MKKSRKIIFKNILLETLAVGICLLLSSGICYLIVHKYHYLLIEKISVVIGIIGILLILVCLSKLPESLFARKIRFVLERNCVKDGYIPKATYQKKNSTVIIEIKLKGSEVDAKIMDVGKEMANALKGYLTERRIESGKVSYTIVSKKYFAPIICKKNLGYSSLLDGQKLRLSENLEWCFRKSPHALICGVSGGGKSFFALYVMRVIIETKKDNNLVVLDPKNSDIAKIAKYHGIKTACEKAEILKILRECVKEMEKVYDDLALLPPGMDYFTAGLDPHFIIMDEAAAFFAALDKKEKEEYIGTLKQIVLKGRGAGYCLLVFSQRGDTSSIGGGDVRDQLSLRIALGNLSDDGREMCFGSAFRNTPMLLHGTGKGMIYIQGEMSTPQPFVAPRITNDFWRF